MQMPLLAKPMDGACGHSPRRPSFDARLGREARKFTYCVHKDEQDRLSPAVRNVEIANAEACKLACARSRPAAGTVAAFNQVAAGDEKDSRMKIVRVAQPAAIDQLRISAADPRPPQPGEVMVRVRATSLNYHELLVVNGGIPTPPGRIPMSDGAGEVLEVGPPLPDAPRDPSCIFKPGDLVMSTFFRHWHDGEPTAVKCGAVYGESIDGYACEIATVPATSLTKAPAGLTALEAATLPCAALTAWRALVVQGGVKAGDTVLVQGSGGVSVFALQIAKAVGATVIATSSSDEKLQRLLALGADHGINYKATPKWGAAARSLTDGRGVDHVVEIGGAGTLNQSITACRVGGHIAMIGVLTGREGEVSTVRLLANQIRLQGVMVGSRADQLAMVRAFEACRIKPIVDASFALEDMGQAFRHQMSGSHFGKISVAVD